MRQTKDTCAFRRAFLGRMLFSCLVDADFRDTERFYCEAEGRIADRDWPELPRVVDDLIARFDCYMQAKKALRSGTDDTPVNHLRGEILAHVRRGAASDRGFSPSPCRQGAARHFPPSPSRSNMPSGMGSIGSFTPFPSPRSSTRRRRFLATCSARALSWSIIRRSTRKNSANARRELAPDPARLHEQLRRVHLAHFGDRTDEELLSERPAGSRHHSATA